MLFWFTKGVNHVVDELTYKVTNKKTQVEAVKSMRVSISTVCEQVIICKYKQLVLAENVVPTRNS